MFDVLGTIYRMRSERGWTEYRLAEESGLPQSTINSWYKKNQAPSFSSLEKICHGFGISLSQFFAEENESVPLTPEQRELIDHWNLLSRSQQNALLQLIRSM